MIYETIQLKHIKFIDVQSNHVHNIILKQEQPELGVVYSSLLPIIVIKNGALQHIAIFGHEILTEIYNDDGGDKKYVVCCVVSSIDAALELIDKIKTNVPEIVSELTAEMKEDKFNSYNIKLLYIPINHVIFSPQKDIDNILKSVEDCGGKYLHIPIVVKADDDSYELISNPKLFTVYTKIFPKDSKIPAFVLSKNFYEQNKKSINKQIQLIYRM